MTGRVVVAMSGGVDSSVAALLLKERGLEVIGLFMGTGVQAADAERRSKTCCSAADAEDARAVADRLDIPFYALDFSADFARIMDDFADEYLAGRTPNPCVRCNVWLKFGRLWAYGRSAGADQVATGHYARTRPGPDGRPLLARGADPGKDQTYVLAGLKREVLDHVLLPIGDYTKAEIRALAREAGLPVHDKPDSQEVCFIPDDDHVRFVRERRPGQESPGAIVDEETGAAVGHHSGVEAFTIGQRRGLGVALGSPRFVLDIDSGTNVVTIGPRESLDRPGLIADRFHWQAPEPAGPIDCLAQIRARHRAVPATAEPLGGGRVQVRFAEPQAAVTPGQVVALYSDDLLLGGGWIDRALATD